MPNLRAKYGQIPPGDLGSGTPTSLTFLDGSGAWRPLTGSDIPQHSAALLNSGTLDVARLNGGNSTQFVRADGTNSNTLTGGLTLGNALNLGSSGTLDPNSYQVVGAGGGVQINAPTAGFVSILNQGTNRLTANSTGLVSNGSFTLQTGILSLSAGHINLPSSNTSANTGFNCLHVNASGPRLNCASGSNAGVQVAGVDRLVVNNNQIIPSVPVTMGAQYLSFSPSSGSLDTSVPSACGGTTGFNVNAQTGASVRAQIAGTVNSNFGAAFGTASASSWAVGQYGATTTTAGQSGIASNGGTVWYNTTTNNTHDFRIQNVQNSIFGASFGTAGDTRWAIGQFAVGAQLNTATGIAADSSGHVYYNAVAARTHKLSIAGQTGYQMAEGAHTFQPATSSVYDSDIHFLSNNYYTRLNFGTTATSPVGVATQGRIMGYGGSGLYVYGFPGLSLRSTSSEGLFISDSLAQFNRNLSFTSGFGIPEEALRSYANGGPNLGNFSLKQLRSAQNILPNSSIAGTAVQTRVTGVAVPGGAVFSYTGNGAATVYLGDSLIPVDPTKTYSARAWAANTVNSPDTYIGLYCYNSAGSGIGWVYCCANGVKPPSGGQWYQGYCSGTGINGVSQFPAGTAYVCLGYLTGYGSPTGAWTTQISPIEFIEVPAQCGAFHNATQSLADTTWTAASFNSEILDTSNLHDTATNTDRVNVPRTGKYRITAQAEFAANATGYRQARITVNGSALARSTKIVPNNGASLEAQAGIEIYALLTAGDIVRLEAYQDSGGALNLTNNTRLYLLWISD